LTDRSKRALLLESRRRQGFEPKIVYRSEREDWIQMMVAAGHGVTLMPESLYLGHGTLAQPLIDPALNREVALGPAVAMNGAACWSSHGAGRRAARA
jgi:LysR family transcriptional regulator, hydrogen peroxide-inducible genes activator